MLHPDWNENSNNTHVIMDKTTNQAVHRKTKNDNRETMRTWTGVSANNSNIK